MLLSILTLGVLSAGTGVLLGLAWWVIPVYVRRLIRWLTDALSAARLGLQSVRSAKHGS